MAIFAYGWMMTSIFPSSARSRKDLVASGMGLKKRKIQKISLELIVACDKCQVSLCISFYKPFHTASSVSKLQSEALK